MQVAPKPDIGFAYTGVSSNRSFTTWRSNTMLFITQVTFVAGHEKVDVIAKPQTIVERLLRAPVESHLRKTFVSSIKHFRVAASETDTAFTVPATEREELRAVLHTCAPYAAAGLYQPVFVLCGTEDAVETTFPASRFYDSIEKALHRMDRPQPAWLQQYIDQVRDVFSKWAEQGFTHVSVVVEGAYTRADLSTLPHDELVNL